MGNYFLLLGYRMKIQEPRCQDPKKKYKRKPRAKERIQKKKNLIEPPNNRDSLRFFLWSFLILVPLYSLFGSWHLGSWFFVVKQPD